jgi:hypothetical protein
MNFRQTAILLGAILVLGVVLFAVTYTTEDAAPEGGALTEELAAVKPDQIDTLEIERAGAGTLKIVRTDAEKKTWEIVEPYKAPADGGAVEATIGALMRAKPVAHPELSSSLAAHGLEPPGLKVTLRQGTDKSSTVNLGDVSIGGSKGVVFVTTSARPKRPMAVPRFELDPLFKESKPGKAADVAKWVGDYRSHSVFPGGGRAMGEDVASLKLSLPNKKKELALSRTPSGGWKFDAPAGWGEADAEGDPAAALGTFTGVNPLLRTLVSMNAGSAADFIDNPADLKQYGLNADNPDLVRVELKTKDGQTTVAYVGKTEGGAPGAPGGGGKAYVRVEGQPGVIRASAGNLSGLVPVVTDPGPLRERALIALDPHKQVDGIDIVLAGQPADRPTKLRRVGADWKLYGGPGDPQGAYAAPIQHIIDVVTARRAINGFPAPNPGNFASVAATLWVWVDGFGAPPGPSGEPAKKAEPTKIEFGRKEGDSIHVRRTRPGGEVNEFTVPAMLRVGAESVDVLATVSKSRLDLLDRSLPSFADAAKITVSGAANYALAHDEKPDPSGERQWRFASPDPRAGQAADAAAVRNDVIYYLANASAQFGRFVDEAPTPQKLTEYGLAPAARLKAVVEVPGAAGGKPRQIVYEFGKDTPDPAFVYARAEGRPAVFTLGRTVFDKLANADLRDRAVFHGVPADKVNEVEVTGWGGVALKFQKNKDGAWAAQPPTFSVDPAKVSAFLSLVGRTRAKAFEKGPPKPEQGFADPKQNLQATLKWPGGAVTLKIGAPADGGQSFYAWSSTLPQSDPVFTVDAAPFKPYKEGPGGFAK